MEDSKEKTFLPSYLIPANLLGTTLSATILSSATHTDVVVEVFPGNTAKENCASKQVAKITYSSNLYKSCSFITDV
jgi:hypothetical protein